MFGVTPTGNQFSHYLKRRNYRADLPSQRYSIKTCSGPLWFFQHKVCLHKQMPVLNRKHLHILKFAGSLSNYLMALGAAWCFRNCFGWFIITSKWSFLFYWAGGLNAVPARPRWGTDGQGQGVTCMSAGLVAAVQ